VFQTYANVPLPAIIRAEWRHASKFSFLGAGLIPDICFHGLKGFTEGIWEALEDYLGPSMLRLTYHYLPFDPRGLLYAGGLVWKLR
jgi:hypothetical protein